MIVGLSRKRIVLVLVVSVFLAYQLEKIEIIDGFEQPGLYKLLYVFLNSLIELVNYNLFLFIS